jgi:hypothetical protein
LDRHSAEALQYVPTLLHEHPKQSRVRFLCMMAKGYAYADACRPANAGKKEDQWKKEITERCYRK